MTQSKRLGVVTLVVLLMGLGAVYLAATNDSRLARATPTVIALAALFVSLLGEFKDSLLPFDLDLIAGVVVVPASPEAGRWLVLPMAFMNRGYAEDVVEGVAAVAEADGRRWLLRPIVELQPNAMLLGGPLHRDHVLATFQPFVLQGKSTQSKLLLFQLVEQLEYTTDPLVPAAFDIRLFAKARSWATPRQMREFPFNFTPQTIETAATGTWASVAGLATEIVP